jgi:hypothetical protein
VHSPCTVVVEGKKKKDQSAAMVLGSLLDGYCGRSAAWFGLKKNV